MKNYNFKTDRFFSFFLISLGIHGALVGGSQLMPTMPQVSVVQAPNSIAVSIIEEIVPQIEVPRIEEIPQEKINKEQIDIEPIAQVNDIPNAPEVNVPKFEKPLPKEKVKEEVKETIVLKESVGAVSEPVPVEYVNPAPKYPRKAIRREWEGTVLLRVRVEQNGRPSNIEIEKSSGYSMLDDSAVETVYTWQFTPAKSGNLDFAAWVTIPIEFRLIND